MQPAVTLLGTTPEAAQVPGHDVPPRPGHDVPPRPAEGACRPFVKWAGGKRQLLPELKRYVPERFERYI
ncbi:MAG: hypothetical protein RL685_1503, partial [Pseudomonadota bacterium]